MMNKTDMLQKSPMELVIIIEGLQQHNNELAAIVKRLSEGMKAILGWRELRDTSDVPIERIEEVARMALEATPQQSLAEHDAEVERKAYVRGYVDASQAYEFGCEDASTEDELFREALPHANEYAKSIKESE